MRHGRPLLLGDADSPPRSVRVYRDSGGAWACVFEGGMRYPQVDLWMGIATVSYDEDVAFRFQMPYPDDWTAGVEEWKEGFRIVAVGPGAR